ncbi:MAG TPA: single-stranded-DNA-specific exonuclease RecJ [Candidatus Krumholzibacteria bacterium]|nr:single-stranded-DNA-specific exonuclease RecJ [Candidatus Krumholzibacteria bacterium]
MPQQSSTPDGGPGPLWDLPTRDDLRAGADLAHALALPTVAGQILWRRGFTAAEAAARWLEPDAADLHDPSDLPDLDAAVVRIGHAIDDGERIVVHGDYDADGICGTALLTRGLRRLGAVVEPFVPDRQRDGYGVARRLIEHAGRSHVGLLITVDTGSAAHEALGRARELGIDVIVCDHHRFERHPDGAEWFVNPLRPDSRYPHADLCGGGIAYQLLRAVAAARGGDADEELPLAALATIGDQMPLRGENRILVRRGLAALGATRIPGLRALMEVARIGRRVDVEDVAFQIAPRINAPGRIERARTTLDLLLAPDAVSARSGAQRLEALNRERKRIGAECADDAVAMAERRIAERDPAGLVLSSPAWHRGVVGIAAAKVARAYGRPALLLAVEGDGAVGSARSVPGVDLVEVLDQCADLLDRYGGHAAAAGLAVASEHVAELEDRFHRAIRRPAGAEVAPPLRIDAILGHEDLDEDLAAFLNALGPFGQDNPSPRLAGLGWRHRRSPRVVGERHLRLDLDHGGRARGLIAFGQAEAWMPTAVGAPDLDVAFTVRYRPDSNYDVWELTLDGLRPASGSGPAVGGQEPGGTQEQP